MSKERKSSARLNYEANCNKRREMVFRILAVTGLVGILVSTIKNNDSTPVIAYAGTGSSFLAAGVSMVIGDVKRDKSLGIYGEQPSKRDLKKAHFFTRRKLFRPTEVDLFGKGTVNN